MRLPHTSPHTRAVKTGHLAVRIVMCQLGYISIRVREPQYLPYLVMAVRDATTPMILINVY